MHYIFEIKDFLNVLHVIRYFNNVHTQARLKLRRQWLDSAFFNTLQGGSFSIVVHYGNTGCGVFKRGVQN
jgi:hypothetical protein